MAAAPSAMARARDHVRTSTGRVLAAYAASRVAVLAGAAVVAGRVGRLGAISRVLSWWDGQWYLHIVAHGYQHQVPAGSGAAAESTLAFFPGYPLLVRA